MLGLDDRVAIREPVVEKADTKIAGQERDKDAKAKPDGKPSDAKSAARPDGAGKPDDKATDANCRPRMPTAIRRRTSRRARVRSPGGLYEFHEERWVELYRKKIDEMIGVLKSRGVPVLWVGLPVVRGPKATADTLI